MSKDRCTVYYTHVYQYVSIVYHTCVSDSILPILPAILQSFVVDIVYQYISRVYHINVSDYVLPTCFLADIFLQSFGGYFVPDFIFHCCYITTLLPSFPFQKIQSTSTYFPFS